MVGAVDWPNADWPKDGCPNAEFPPNVDVVAADEPKADEVEASAPKADGVPNALVVAVVVLGPASFTAKRAE